MLMGVSIIKGDLYDVTFVVLNPTTEAMRVKSTYAGEDFLDGSVLATLVQPTCEDSLRYRVSASYQLFHSVELPSERELAHANVDLLLHRQKMPETVDVFMRGVLNPLGDMRPSVSVLSAAEALVSVATNIHVAQMKKFMWLLRTTKSVPSLAAFDGSDNNSDASHCRVCLQSLSSSSALLVSLKRWSSCAKCSVVKKLNFVSRGSGT